MSNAALQNVWQTILSFDLTAANKRWLAEHLLEQAESESKVALEPYTMAEIEMMAENGRRQIAAGQYFSSEQVLQMCEEA
ncbi:MAG: hypothetical protein J6T76_06815 [Paludibacteraceae bacterium]|nr:hypothetical protein [Paludibacteraceae bacterium]